MTEMTTLAPSPARSAPADATALADRSPWMGRTEVAVVLVLLAAALVPWVSQNLFVYSLTNQILIGTAAAMSAYIMLRMDLLSFALPAFMAIGGYAAAIVAKGGYTNLGLLLLTSFAVPALVALLLGSLVLRLRGTYFVLITFVFNEVLQLLLFEVGGVTGGANGIAGVPSSTLLGVELSSNEAVLWVTTATAVLAAAITAAVTWRYRREFASISENEVLASSLGLVAWRYKTIGLVVSAGVAGLAGFALVNMLLTAHPSSFSTMTGFNYIVYAIVGGQASMFGPLIGAAVLATGTQFFASQGEYSPALYGVLVAAAVMAGKGGLAGLLAAAIGAVQRRFARQGRAP